MPIIDMQQAMAFQEVLHKARQSALMRNDSLALAEATPYSLLMKKWVANALAGITKDDSRISNALSSAFIQGPVATGNAPWFRQFLEGELLGVATRQLLFILYSWLFSGSVHNKFIAASRFFSEEYLYPVDLLFVNRQGIRAPYVFDSFKAFFARHYGFSPTWNLKSANIETIDLKSLLTSYCVYGQSQADMFLNSHSPSTIHKARDSAIRAVTKEILRFGHAETTEQPPGKTGGGLLVTNNLVMAGRQASEPCEDQIADDDWSSRNQHFFSRLAAGGNKKILIEEATKDLNDSKGQEKNRAYTIVRVKGLEENGSFIPSHNCVIKLRGLPHYRSNTNNLFDLIKEFSSYRVLHDRGGRGCLPIPSIGPLLLSCENLTLPFSPEVKQNSVGFFMEAITPQRNQDIHTCRVHNLTDPWRIDKILQTILNSSRDAGFKIPHEQLREKLVDLISKLWSRGLSIDYCDMILVVTKRRDLNKIMLIDFERLCYSEMVEESHVLLETIFDIKTRLPKPMWPIILPVLYKGADSGGNYLPLDKVRGLLDSKGKKRRLYLKSVLFTRLLLSRVYGPQKARNIVANQLRKLLVKTR